MARRKVTYTSTPKKRKHIALTGNVALEYMDDEALESPAKGDLKAYVRCEALHTSHFAEYDNTGFSGYFKFDVWDGKEWRLILLDDIFTQREHHFSKTERPIDTYELCVDIWQELKDAYLESTYREHYQLASEPPSND